MILISIALFALFVIILLKYIFLKKDVNKLYEIGTGRKGYYYYNYGFSCKFIIYINELDRYTNGYSKISIDTIEIVNGDKRDKETINYAITNFLTLKRTDSIEWLDGEMSIKKSRKEKLDKIKKTTKLF